jgi:CDP-glucose 4,6-dehydratase
MENLAVNPRFWEGKRVLLTGHTGFKGSWLSLWLQDLGVQLSGVSQPPLSEPSLFSSAGVERGMHSHILDIRDLGGLVRAVKQEQPEIIIHMAAQSLVRRSYEEPVETYSTNVMGTVHVLEAARHVPGVRVVLVVTSDKCYENREWVWGYREDEAMGGFDPYSNSKGCAELVTSSYRRSFLASSGVSVASARAGNVIGGGDWSADRLVPDMVRAFERGRTVSIRNPNAVRPWQHVLEPLAGYMLLTEKLWDDQSYAGGWNFGADEGDSKPVRFLVERLAAQWGTGAHWEVDQAAHPHEAQYLKLDCSKARTRLGWTTRLPLEEGLEWIVDWHRGHARGEDSRTLTQRQISQYQARLIA